MSRRVADLLQHARELEAPEPPPLHEVRAKAVASQARWQRRVALLAFALAVPLGATAAVGGYAWKKSAAKVVAPPPAPALRRPGVVVPRAEPVVEVPHEEQAAEVALPIAPPVAPRVETLRPAALHVAAPVVTPEIPAVAGPVPAPIPQAPLRTSLAEESALLAQALGAARTQHRPDEALRLVALYRERFQSGALGNEIALVAVEAHQALGQASETLTELDGMARTPELEVLRAELNAQLGRCEVARAGLRGLSATGALRERALFTDATCALQLGQRDDAARLLEELPDSPRARALLEQLR